MYTSNFIKFTFYPTKNAQHDCAVAMTNNIIIYFAKNFRIRLCKYEKRQLLTARDFLRKNYKEIIYIPTTKISSNRV